MRILIVSDAWHPQVNGVVRTLSTLKDGLEAQGHEVYFITPDMFRTLPCPSYPEIRLAIGASWSMRKMVDAFQPCAVHIATEGPLGIAARRYCLKKKYPFTTAYHTRFPEFVWARWRIPLSWTYAVVRRFHKPASTVMVATQTIEDALTERGFDNIGRWSRGVDTKLFYPRNNKDFLDAPRPISMYVGRIAVEKSIDDFLELDLPGTKYVVGDGPQLEDLRKRYPKVRFTGVKEGEELAQYYSAADVFVFPSRTDTFGLVLLEALASGVPVAAYPVPGPLDVIGESMVGVLSEDLRQATLDALKISPKDCRAYAQGYSWEATFRQFIDNLDRFEPSRVDGREDSEELLGDSVPGK